MSTSDMTMSNDRLAVLFHQESLPRYRTTNYLAQIEALASGLRDTSDANDVPGNDGDENTTSTSIDEKWREKISEWAYQVADFFDASREVVSIAMNMLDRCMAENIEAASTMNSRAFQLEAMTCLYLAVKLNEYKYMYISGSKSSMDTMLQLSRGGFTVDQMERMEVDILRRLQWHVNPPTPQLFLNHFLPQIGSTLGLDEHTKAKIHSHASFVIELSVMDYYFVQFKPSEVTRAALTVALDTVLGADSAHAVYEFDAQIDWDSADSCLERINIIYSEHNLSRPQPEVDSVDRSPSPTGVDDDVAACGQKRTAVQKAAYAHQNRRLRQS